MISVRQRHIASASREWQEMVRNVWRILITDRWRKKEKGKEVGSGEERGGEGRRGESCDCVLTLAVTLEANQFPRWLHGVWPSLYEREYSRHPEVTLACRLSQLPVYNAAAVAIAESQHLGPVPRFCNWLPRRLQRTLRDRSPRVRHPHPVFNDNVNVNVNREFI